ncbi:MAG: BON domain-containing protein [Planctomycetaceae bacterium]|nr:BON domain-containing protein [Planctomycetaceae bacterium]
MRKTSLVFCVSCLILLLSSLAAAQDTGSGSTTDSSSGFSGSASDSSSVFSETVDTPTFQGLEDNANRGFVGSGTPDGFVGVDEVYESFAPTNSTTSRNSTSATTRRTATSSVSRTTTNRNTNRTSTGNSGQQLVRSRTVTDIEYVVPQTAQRISAIQTHLKRIQGLQNGDVNIEQTKAGTVAVLTGTAASEKERKVAGQLLLLEPGIDKVDNRLTVVETTP